MAGEAKLSLDPNERLRNHVSSQVRRIHFYSADLIALADRNEYHNEREDWRRFYKSCIVVPIRFGRPPLRSVENRLSSVDTRRVTAGTKRSTFNFARRLPIKCITFSICLAEILSTLFFRTHHYSPTCRSQQQ